MPLLAKHLSYWPTVQHLLFNTLLKICLSSFPEGMLIPIQRKKLFDLVNQTISHNCRDTAFFIVAFEVFATHLDAQELNSAKYKTAITSFKDLPDVQKALVTLQQHINSAMEATPIKVLRTCSTSSEGSRVMSPVEVVATPESDERERTSLSVASMYISVSEKGLSERRLPIPLNIPFTYETLKTEIQAWVDEFYSPVDERIISNDERRLRRLDSLARLLALRMDQSACTAVTIDLSAVPRLVIAANIGSNGEQDSVFTEITSKFHLIKQFLTYVALQEIKSIDLKKLDALAHEFTRILSINTSMTSEVLHQAARKIIDAICFDLETFSEAEKNIFLLHTPSVVILPLMIDKAYYMQIRTIGTETPLNISLPMIPASTSVKDIHAEQLVARTMFHEWGLETPLMIGISKLCCDTCMNYLSLFPVTIRGTHKQVYAGVVNLADGHRTKEGSRRTGNTKHWPSPGDTPERRLRKENPTEIAGEETDISVFRKLHFEPAVPPPPPAGAGAPSPSPVHVSHLRLGLGHFSPRSVCDVPLSTRLSKYTSDRTTDAPESMVMPVDDTLVGHRFFKRPGGRLKPPVIPLDELLSEEALKKLG